MIEGQDDELRPRRRGRGVGYGRPPAEHRFKKGVSGNPKGRPRKPKHELGAMPPDLADLVLSEAGRLVTIRENDKTTTMPTIQALLRTIIVTALKGNLKAQVAATTLFKDAEQSRLNGEKEHFEAAFLYKMYWEEKIRRRDELGESWPDPGLHPADIGIDVLTGTVVINGPLGDAEIAKWDKAERDRAGWIEAIAFGRRELQKFPEDRVFIEDDMAYAQWLIDQVDRTYPDKEARRAPGFNIDHWRERQLRKHEKLGKVKPPKPSCPPAKLKSARAK